MSEAALGKSGALRARRPFGVRLYLTIAFAVVALITASLAYLLVRNYAEGALEQRSTEIAVGRTVRLADRVARVGPGEARRELLEATDERYSAWLFDREGEPISAPVSGGVHFEHLPREREAVDVALGGLRRVDERGGGVNIVSLPIFNERGRISGVVVARAGKPQEFAEAIDALRGDGFTALSIALIVAVVAGALIASLITGRVKRLAESATWMTEGRLDEPLEGIGGRDEISDLGRSLETMRIALRDTFGALRSERDRLSAIFDSLTDAVMVIGPDSIVRFSNPAAQPLIGEEGRAIGGLVPWLRRATRSGSAEHDSLRIGERVYAIGVRRLPAEGAVLAVVRDRTEELRREVAEREFVSNAAHELRNPIAGISSALEVLRSGAKEDPEARDHFLSRLYEDTERISRLTESLLTLARMESVGEGGGEALDVQLAIEEATQGVEAPAGIEVRFEVEPDLMASGDPVLLRQVLGGLLVNAFKHTSPPGSVTLRARRERLPGGRDGGDGGLHGEGQAVRIEVADTGVGIPAEDRERVFERFYRGSGAFQKDGFGLGLSIAKRMVDVMGGEIGVESEVGVGSTFWIRLQAAKPVPTPVA